jgi:RES domain-containing protein
VHLFRIAQLKYPIFSGFGAAKQGGRWNSPGQQIIYTATSLAGAKLELLAQGGAFGLMPKGYGYVIVAVPDGVEIKRYPRRRPPKLEYESQGYGDEWANSLVSSILLVPSAASPGDWNALINPLHPDFKRLVVGKERKLIWDKRHFRL